MFSCEFCEICKKPFLQNTTGRLLLIIAVSIVVKGELAKETVNYDTKTKTCNSFSQKCKLSKKGSSYEILTGFRSSRSQMFFKSLQILQENTCVGDTF